MSRRNDRSERAWDDGAPTLRERFKLAIRQNPIRGGSLLLLLLLALTFLGTAVVTFRAVQWLAIIGVGVVLVALVIAVVGGATLLMRRD